jgi:hypothetical protein
MDTESKKDTLIAFGNCDRAGNRGHIHRRDQQAFNTNLPGSIQHGLSVWIILLKINMAVGVCKKWQLN